MSANAKRKREDLEDSDDEEPMLGRQVLPVANLPETFDGVPLDGLQYLFTVRRDARMLPHVTRVANPYEVPEPPEAVSLPGPSGLSQVRDVLPIEEWRETFLMRFKNFRKNSAQPTIHVHIPDSSAKLMPDKKERDLWWAFLTGRPESEWNPPRKPKQPKVSRWQQRKLQGKGARPFADDLHEDASLSYDFPENASEETLPSAGSKVEAEVSYQGHAAQSLPTPSGTPAPPETPADISIQTDDMSVNIDTPIPPEPTPMLMQHIDHKYALHLLMYFTHWINLRLEQPSLPLSEITESHARWMFALLSRVDDWISGDETSLLRNLARACISFMDERRRRHGAKGKDKEISEEGDGVNMMDEASCWMIVSAIAGMWGQKDLWMDAEAVLSKAEAELS